MHDTLRQPEIRRADNVDLSRYNSWVEISRAAFAHNFRFFRNRVGDEVELSSVVKANAYGHGWREIATLARENGADSFCVHSLDEALDLRGAGFEEDVLIMGHVPLQRLEEVVEHDLRMMLVNGESLELLAEITERLEKRVRVHLKVETGTHRQGITEDELEHFLAYLREHPRIVLDGVYTHYANIEDTTRHDYAESQLERFRRHSDRILAAGFQVARHKHEEGGEPSFFRRHTACSAAVALFPRTHYEMVRLGISQYGLWSSKETYLSYILEHGAPDPEAPVLRPVMTWKTRLGQVKPVPAGAYIGYGCSYQTTRDSRIAILPVGYSDGYDRRLSNQAYVLVRGRRAPVRGRVCMNLTMVDVTDIPDAALEDEVVLLGRQGEQEITAGQLGDWIGTINYEVVTRIQPKLPRIVV